MEWVVNRVMPDDSPYPGPVDPSRNPYLDAPSESFIAPKVDRTTLVMGTQQGKSFYQETVLGKLADDDPSKMIYYAPTRNNINRKVEPVMLDMIKQTPSLRAKFDEKNSTQYEKKIGGSTLYLSWLGSTTETASTTARYVMVDELDRCSKNSEGSVVELVEARGEAFADSRVGFVGTPTLGRVKKYRHEKSGLEHWELADADAVPSQTWQQWQQGTRHEWAIPCPDPDCGEYFIPHAGLLHWQGREHNEAVGVVTVEKTAALCCPNNGCVIPEAMRHEINARGVFVAPGQSITKEGEIQGVAETDGNTHHSYHVSGLCSFSEKKSYGYLARKLYNALQTDDPEILQPVYNTGFGEVFAMQDEAPPWQGVKEQSWQYVTGQVLGSPEFLIATVDVQQNRLVYVVRAWYRGMSSALVECGELIGDPQYLGVWDDLEELYERDFSGFAISEIGVDVGFLPYDCFDFVERNKGRARALRGASLDMPFRKKKQDLDKKGRPSKRGSERWDFDSPRAKAWVHSRIGRDMSQNAFWLLPSDIDDGYCKQIVGEVYETRTGQWKKVNDNHFLDCESMSYMLARMRNLKARHGCTKVADLSVIETPPQRKSAPQTKSKENQPQEKQPEARPNDGWITQYDGDWI